MAGSTSIWLENNLLAHALGITNFAKPGPLYLAAFITSPTATLAGQEPAASEYTRMAISFGAVSSGTASNSGSVTFPSALSTWGSIGWVGVFDAPSAGDYFFYAPITPSLTITSGQQLIFPAASLVFQFA